MSTKLNKNSELNDLSVEKNSQTCECSVHKSEQLRNKEYKALKKRAVRNYLSVKIKSALVGITNSPLHYSYKSSLACTKTLVQVENEFKSLYCGSRWCPVCGAIRTAKMIEGYLPVIQKEFKDPRSVTVSVPNPFGWELRSVTKEMSKTVREITDWFRKTHHIKLKAVKKIECTHNEEKGTYHPHMSFIMEGKKVADMFINEWLIRFPDASRSGQYHKKADRKSIKELFKYTVKLVADSEIEVKALDVIFCSLFGMRTIQPIGIKKIVPDENEVMEDLIAQKIDIKPDSALWDWVQSLSDWFNRMSGEGLTGCEEYKKDNKPPGKLKEVETDPTGVNIHIVGKELKAKVEAFEAGKMQNIKLIRNINTGQIYDYEKVNLEKGVLYEAIYS